MSFLTDEENSGLTLRRIILHVVGGEEDFEPQEELVDLEHDAFFLQRIRELAADGVHSFIEGSERRGPDRSSPWKKARSAQTRTGTTSLRSDRMTG